MLTLLKRFAVYALILGCLPCCGKFDFQGQDLSLKHDALADSLELELIYNGVRMPPVTTYGRELGSGQTQATAAEAVCEAVEGVAEGRRYLMLFFKAVSVDLDKYETELRAEQAEKPTEQAQGYLSLLESITLKQSAVFLDATGRVGIRQLFHLKQARRATALVNRELQRIVLEETKSGDFAKDTAEFFDAATRAAFVAEARTGRPWLRWEEADLIISLPVTSESSAHLLLQLLEEQTREEQRHLRAFAPVLFGLVQNLKIEDQRLVLTLGAGMDGCLRLELEEDPREYSTQLLKELQAREFAFAPDPTLGE